MYIGRSQQEEEKYLNTTINAINELIDEYGGLSTEQDKEIRKQQIIYVYTQSILGITVI